VPIPIRLVLCLCLTAPAALAAQATPPRIVASGSGEVMLPPDNPVVAVAVETRAPSAAAAAAQNASVVAAVRQALQRAGVHPDSMQTTGYGVSPVSDFDGGTRRERGYVAQATLNIPLSDMERVGAVIDLALASGANRVVGVSFRPRGMDAARRAALAQAVSEAREDAEAMARAAGGSLGALQELTSAHDAGEATRVVIGGANSIGTSITPGDIRVSAMVMARWTFVAP
jgi:uncharacterized protein